MQWVDKTMYHEVGFYVTKTTVDNTATKGGSYKEVPST